MKSETVVKNTIDLYCRGIKIRKGSYGIVLGRMIIFYDCYKRPSVLYDLWISMETINCLIEPVNEQEAFLTNIYGVNKMNDYLEQTISTF